MTKQQQILRNISPEKRARIVKLAGKPHLKKIGEYRIHRIKGNEYFVSDDSTDPFVSFGPLTLIQAAAKPYRQWIMVRWMTAISIAAVCVLLVSISLFPRISRAPETVSVPLATRICKAKGPKTSSDEHISSPEPTHSTPVQTMAVESTGVKKTGTMITRPTTISTTTETSIPPFPKTANPPETFSARPEMPSVTSGSQKIDPSGVSGVRLASAVDIELPLPTFVTEWDAAFTIDRLWRSIRESFPPDKGVIVSETSFVKTETVSGNFRQWATCGRIPETWRVNWFGHYSTFFTPDLWAAFHGDIVPAGEFSGVKSATRKRYKDGRVELIFEAPDVRRLWVTLSLLVLEKWADDGHELVEAGWKIHLLDDQVVLEAKTAAAGVNTQ